MEDAGLKVESRFASFIIPTQPTSAGGSNDPSNFLTLCSLCHSNIHKGRLRIRGENPSVEFFHKDIKGKEIPFGESVCRT